MSTELEKSKPSAGNAPAGKRQSSAAAVREELIETLVRMGHPEEFGVMIAASLKSEKAMARMSSYLHQFRPTSAEEIADEMLAILEDHARWRDKKVSEYYNRKYNEYLNRIPDEEE